MGREIAEIRSVVDDSGLSDEPRFGTRRESAGLGFPKGTVIRYFIGCVTDPSNRSELESIMTRSLACGGVMKKPGDVYVISETGTFDRDGCYQVAVKYLYLPE